MSDKDKLSAAFSRCPLCGGKPVFNVIFEDGSDVYGNVECPSCGLYLMGADGGTFEKQIAVWNNRRKFVSEIKKERKGEQNDSTEQQSS